MKKLIFALIGTGVALLLYTTFLMQTPSVMYTSSKPPTSNNQDEPQDPFPGEIQIKQMKHYSITPEDIDLAIERGQLFISRTDPMRFILEEKAVNPPEEQADDSFNSGSKNEEKKSIEELTLDTFKSGIVLPVGSTDIIIKSGFGNRTDPISNETRFHKGIDIAYEVPGEIENEPVYAVYEGTIAFAGEAGGAGNMVRIDHGGSIETKYMHLSKILVNKGDKVESGQEIGRVGQTGRATGPHLHFEVLVNGEHQEPVFYLPIYANGK
jgi:murein DD-endopeptidase MepM/ murein hydrolase activator NlpD